MLLIPGGQQDELRVVGEGAFTEWKTLYSAMHLDEAELNSEANKIVEQSMRQLSAFRSAVAEQRLLQEAKLEQRLLVRRAIRRQQQSRQ